MLLLLLFSFLSGIITILAPCIWPILPIILSSSVGGSGAKRPAAIVVGIIVSFTVVTLTISTLVRIFPIDPNVLRTIAIIIIALLGLSLVIPALSTRFEGFISRLSSRWAPSGAVGGNDRSVGFITGLSLGVVWAPCAGPILATITALAATGRVTSAVVGVTIAYVSGVGVPLFALALGGQKILTQSRRLSPYTSRIQQVFGVVMIATALAMFTGYDQTVQIKLLNALPSYTHWITAIEQSPVVQKQLSQLNGTDRATTNNAPIDTSTLFNANDPAPELAGITHWLNTNALTLKQLRGKVVLIDFWTYTCINCIRTLPHVTKWYDTYHDKGFVVIGVHTPEFEFEKETKNVQKAVERFGIHYPVAQDNDYGTWKAFNNRYWPAEYLIDPKGNIRRTHFGEGEYDQTEQAIRALLKENGENLSEAITIGVTDQTSPLRLSPETYVGSARMQYFYPSGGVNNGTRTFVEPVSIPVNSFALGGEWNIEGQYSTTGPDAKLQYHFGAQKVFLVLRPGLGKNGTMKVLLDGKIVERANAGSDVSADGIVTVDSDRLYNLIDLRAGASEHTLNLEFTPGIQVFAFTFG